MYKKAAQLPMHHESAQTSATFTLDSYALPFVLGRSFQELPALALFWTKPLQRQAVAASAAFGRHLQAATSGKAPGQAQRAAQDCQLPLS